LESLATFLRERTQDIPTFGSFLATVGTALLGIALGAFFARNTAPVRFLRDRLERLLGGLVAALLLAMVFLSMLQIVLRNVFDSGFLWIDPLLRHLVLVLAFAGALIATGMKRHVQINVIGRLFHGTSERVVGVGVSVVAAVICLGLVHASLDLVATELAYPEILFLDIPSWLMVLVFPVSFALLAFRFLFLGFLEIAGEAPHPAEGEIEALDPEPDVESKGGVSA
jgi:TRAP-type C4-dicarboxylate transport system permease small subunit